MSGFAVRARARTRSAVAALIAVGAVVAGSLAGASAAHAADTPTVVDSVTFQQSTFQDQSVQTLSVDWHATESPASPVVRVRFDLPAELIGQTTTFDIGNGTCAVTSTSVTCTVDDSYVEQHPLNVHGSFQLGVRVDLKNHETVTGKTFEVGGVMTPPVTITSRYCQTNCEFGGSGASKGGSYNNANDQIGWTVQVPTGGTGVDTAADGRSMAPGQTVTVADTFAGNDFTIVAGPTVQFAGCVVTDQWDYQTPVYNTVPAADLDISADRTSVTFTTAAGGCSVADQGRGDDPTALDGTLYRVSWTVHANDLGKGVTGPGQYSNTATISVGGTDRSVTGSAVRRSYGGTAIGENFARFQLRKAFDVAADVLTPSSVTIDYTIAYPGGSPASTSGQITLDAGNGWEYLSPEIFAGSTVTLTEVNPWPANVHASATLTDGAGAPVAAAGGSYTFTATHTETPLAYTLTNAATLDAQSLAAKKVLDNPDGVTIPDGTTFELTASWPDDADLAIRGGSASVRLPADGSTVSFADLPVGAHVTFSETAPEAIPGATWTSSTVTPGALTIGEASAGVTVTATNALSRDVGTFTIEKQLAGDAASLVTDRTFEVAYSYPADPGLGIEAGSGTVEVEAGGAPVVVTAPAGAEVTLSETPVNVTGGTWAQPVFDPGSTFTVTRGGNVAILLTNLITLDTGAFSIHKVVDGTGASMLPGGAGFTVRYSYPAGDGFAAGDGELTVAAGATATSPQLPYGAVVSLEEEPPEGVAGATWSEPGFSRSTVTIGDGTTVEVTLTNTLTDDHPAVVSPTGPGLPVTGGTIAPVLVPAVLLIAAGAVLLILRRRRRA